MKITIGILIVLSIATISHNTIAQEKSLDNIFNKGNSLLGGGVSIRSNNQETTPIDTLGSKNNYDNKSFAFTPYFGKFIKNNLLIGGRLYYSKAETESASEYNNTQNINNSSSTHYGFGFFLKKYLVITGRFGVFIKPEISFGILKSENKYEIVDLVTKEILTSRKNDSDGNNFRVTTNLGLYFTLSKSFLIETNLLGFSISHISQDISFSDLTNNNNSESKSKSTALNLDLINTLSFDQILVINYIF
jgi:hypothetical protein